MSFVAFLFFACLAGGVWWLIGYGGAYWDNISIKGDLHEAANLCMKEPDDGQIRKFIVTRINKYGGAQVAPDDVVINRDPGKYVSIDVAYSRVVKPLFAGERTVTFTRHVEQDLKPVKW